MSIPTRSSTHRYLLRLLCALVVSLLSIGFLLWLLTPVMLVASYLRSASSASTPTRPNWASGSKRFHGKAAMALPCAAGWELLRPT